MQLGPAGAAAGASLATASEQAAAAAAAAAGQVAADLPGMAYRLVEGHLKPAAAAAAEALPEMAEQLGEQPIKEQGRWMCYFMSCFMFMVNTRRATIW